LFKTTVAVVLATSALFCAAALPVVAQGARVVVYVLPEIYESELEMQYVVPSASRPTWVSLPRSVNYLSEDGPELVDAPDDMTKHALLEPHDSPTDFTATVFVRRVREGKKRILHIPTETSFEIESFVVQVVAVRRMQDFSITPGDSVQMDTRDGVEYWRVDVDPKTTPVITIEYTNPDPFPFDTPAKRWGIGVSLGGYSTSHDDLQQAFGETLSPGLYYEGWLAWQWSWNAVELTAGGGFSSGDFDELDIAEHSVDQLEWRVSLWYRRHLPPLGVLGGLWLMGGAGYSWVDVSIAPWTFSELPASEQFTDSVAEARGPIASVGALWVFEVRDKESSTGGRGMIALEYRYTWSNLTTTDLNERWLPPDATLNVSGHTIMFRVGWLLGTEKPVTEL